MHSPEYVLEKAQNRYRSVWRGALLDADPGAYAVALDPPSAAAITDRAGEVSAWLSSWREWAVQHPEVTLRTRTIRTKFGTQPVHTHLDIPGISALANLSPDTAVHWQRARGRWAQLHRDQVGQTVRPWLTRIVDLDEYDFTILLAAANWFRAYPRSGLTVRSVPVAGMHTKWLARHRSMVLACLGTATDSGQLESARELDPLRSLPPTSTPSGYGRFPARSALSLATPSCGQRSADCARSPPP
jgi:hypothetical protein